MPLYFLDETLQVDVFFDRSDCEFDDNVCIRFTEACPEEEKVFWAGETNIYLTPAQARAFAQALLAAAAESCTDLPGQPANDQAAP